MVLITGNRRLWGVSMAVSLILFAIVYFTVIRPDNNTANQALRTGLQQTQQALNQAQQQVSSAGGAASSAGNAALSKASKLTACIAKAGTDVTALSNCQSQYGG
jgi:type II secretory pathway component PulM